MDMNAAFAARGYAATRPATAPDPTVAAAGRLAGDFAATLGQAEAAGTSALAGGTDTHTLVQKMAETRFAVETAVAVRDKVVEAYQEILRMPV